MENVVLISIPETTISNLVEQAVKKALTEYEATHQASANQKTIFDFKEGCQYMGISTSHGYKLTSQGKIPHSKRGKKIYFEKAVLDEYMTENRVMTIKDMKDETDEYLRKKANNKSNQ